MKNIAHLTVYFKDKEIICEPIELLEQDGSIGLIQTISESGTEKLQYLKLPTSKTSFIIINKKQLDEVLIDVRIETIKERKTRKKVVVVDEVK